MPLGSVAGFTVMAALIVTAYACEPVAPKPSVAVTVKLDVAAVVGVPAIAPVAALSESPAGKLPAETLNVYEPLPPVALTVCEYAGQRPFHSAKWRGSQSRQHSLSPSKRAPRLHLNRRLQ